MCKLAVTERIYDQRAAFDAIGAVWRLTAHGRQYITKLHRLSTGWPHLPQPRPTGATACMPLLAGQWCVTIIENCLVFQKKEKDSLDIIHANDDYPNDRPAVVCRVTVLSADWNINSDLSKMRMLSSYMCECVHLRTAFRRFELTSPRCRWTVEKWCFAGLFLLSNLISDVQNKMRLQTDIWWQMTVTNAFRNRISNDWKKVV